MIPDDIPWATFILTLGMVVIYIISPEITPLSYTLLAPWMHSGFSHLWQNLFIFVLLGTWVETRVRRVTFLLFSVLIPYLALYLPVVLNYGSLSRGASGLTNALIGYVIVALLVNLSGRIRSSSFNSKQVTIGLGIVLVLIYLTAGAWLTFQRFTGLEPRPDGVAVSSHMTGIVLGLLWFAWRTVRHGLKNA